MISDGGVFYLKKVYILLQDEERQAQFAALADKLQERGVICDIRVIREDAAEGTEDPAAGIVDVPFPVDAEAPAAEAVLVRKSLYITDDENVLKELINRNLPTAAYLHEGNRGQDFSGVKYAFENPKELEPEYLERVYRRFSGLPWDILQTGHCILRESIPEDIDAFYEIYREPGMTQYTDALYEHKSSEKAALKEYIEKVYHYYEFGIWTVLLKETGQVIGRAGLNIREGYETPELGYMIGKPWQGKGMATEVGKGILEYAKEEFGFERIRVLIHPDNAASLRVAEKLGFCEPKKVVFDGSEHILLLWEGKISQ